MASYRVDFTTAAERDIEKLPAEVTERIYPRIRALAQNPHPRGCIKLSAVEGLWRIRVGDYRVLYSVDSSDRAVHIIRIKHRAKAY